MGEAGDFFDPLLRIRHRVRDVAKTHGLREERSGVTISDAPELQMVFVLDENFLLKAPDTIAPEFDDVIRGAGEATQALRAEEAKQGLEELRERLEGGGNGGFLDP